MIKSGYYALYKGKEYSVNHDEKKKIHIFTNNIRLIDRTFIKCDAESQWYKKSVQPYELDDVYDISTFAYVDGDRRLGVMKEKDDMLLVSTGRGHMDLIEKFHLVEVDRGVFEGWISKSEVQLVEERKDMTRQFGVVKKTD